MVKFLDAGTGTVDTALYKFNNGTNACSVLLVLKYIYYNRNSILTG